MLQGAVGRSHLSFEFLTLSGTHIGGNPRSRNYVHTDGSAYCLAEIPAM